MKKTAFAFAGAHCSKGKDSPVEMGVRFVEKKNQDTCGSWRGPDGTILLVVCDGCGPDGLAVVESVKEHAKEVYETACTWRMAACEKCDMGSIARLFFRIMVLRLYNLFSWGRGEAGLRARSPQTPSKSLTKMRPFPGGARVEVENRIRGGLWFGHLCDLRAMHPTHPMLSMTIPRRPPLPNRRRRMPIGPPSTWSSPHSAKSERNSKRLWLFNDNNKTGAALRTVAHTFFYGGVLV